MARKVRKKKKKSVGVDSGFLIVTFLDSLICVSNALRTLGLSTTT